MRKIFTLFVAALCCANMFATEGALSGKFTINAQGNRVQFSQGNLQYQASTATWRFAENQYDYVGDSGHGNVTAGVMPSDNSKISDTYTGWIDLFGYATGNNPTLHEVSSAAYASGMDWGYNAISNGGNTPEMWRCLTLLEWMYIVNNRKGAKDKIAKATVVGVQGIILLPDDWKTVPSGITLTITSSDWTTNTYNATKWKKLEDAGAVFLPAAGYRMDTKVLNTNETAYYWSMSYDQKIEMAGGMYSTNGLSLSHSQFETYKGFSVRLVQPCDNAPDPETEPVVYTEYDATSHTVTYYYDAERESRTGVVELYYPGSSHFPGYYNQIQKIIVHPSMMNAPLTSMNRMFTTGANYQPLSAMTEIEGLENLNTAEVTDMREMFAYCEALTTLDLTSFDISKVEDTRLMFYGCSALTTIYCNDDWSSTSAQTTSMFSQCSSLVGGQGTPYSSSHVDASYARPDEPDSDKPGYFSKKGEQAIENIATPADKARKVMMDGTLYIATPDGKIYNATGVQVK